MNNKHTFDAAWDPMMWSVAANELAADLPLVTIGILNYNRCAPLRMTLDCVFRSTQYPNFEVVLVDNGSTDGSLEMVRNEFPQVRLFALDQNFGTSSRNIQTREARGKYLFSYDDDSMPATPATVYRMVKYMEEHSDIDVLNASCYQPLTGYLETSGWDMFRYGGSEAQGYEGIYLVEGGVCYRVESLRKVEGYDPALFYAAEGPDLALQFYRLGMKVVLCFWFATMHLKSELARDNDRATFWRARHTVWMIGKHFPRLLQYPMIALFFLRRVIVGALLNPHSWTPRYTGFLEGIRGLKPFAEKKPKLSMKQLLGLKRFYLQLYRW